MHIRRHDNCDRTKPRLCSEKDRQVFVYFNKQVTIHQNAWLLGL